jgi:hypothetical protein
LRSRLRLSMMSSRKVFFFFSLLHWPILDFSICCSIYAQLDVLISITMFVRGGTHELLGCVHSTFLQFLGFHALNNQLVFLLHNCWWLPLFRCLLFVICPCRNK